MREHPLGVKRVPYNNYWLCPGSSERTAITLPRAVRPLTPMAMPKRTVRTEGLWIKCMGCRQAIWKADLAANLNVCPKCQHHFKFSARQRIDMLLEPGYELVDRGLRSTDPLEFY